MPFTPPTTPEEAYELSPFGFGPFPLPGESVDVAPPHPDGGGYGGVGFVYPSPPAGTPYGLGAYGSHWFGRPRLNIDGGYGGDPYGLGPYGGIELVPPYLTAAVPISAYEIEVYFSEDMDPANPALLDPAAYTIATVTGAAPVDAITSVHIEKVGSLNTQLHDYVAGVQSVVLTHSGTTIGGTYLLSASGMTDFSGNLLGGPPVWFLARGQSPQATVILPPLDTGNQLLVVFDQDMLPAVDEPGPGPGITSPLSYEITSAPTYPIDMTVLDVEHSATNSRLVTLTVQGMTGIIYDMLIGPAFDYSYLPATGLWNCVRVDSGTGTAVVSGSNLVVGRLKNNAWQLEWQDTSGLIVPSTSTVRMDFTYDFSAAVYSPAITTFPNPQVAEVVFQDGPPMTGVLVRVVFQYGVGNTPQIYIESGTFTTTMVYNWDAAGAHQISYIRNQKAGTVTFLLDDEPLTSSAIANFDGVPDTVAGTRFKLLDGGWDISGVRVRGLQTTSSTTIFSKVWNFMHEYHALFVGSSVLTRQLLFTQRGPLVKGWGDATPATKQDVSLLVNGVSVGIDWVNPFIGSVYPTIPIPLLPVGDPQADVRVNYQWFKSPIMELEGLNVPGLVINKFDCPRRGHHDPASHGETHEVKPPPMDEAHAKGAVDTHRFPMGIVLGPMVRPKPLYIGHRYMGFERSYSALTNSPTTLTLNQAPGRTAVLGFDRMVQGVSVAYEGLVKPIDASPTWLLTGTDFGGVDHSAETGDLGTYTIIDAKKGGYDTGDTRAAVYRRGLDLSFPSALTLVARFQTAATNLFDTAHPSSTGADTTLVTPDGVFTGVGFGVHDNQHLYLCGVLRVNGLEHVGLLLDPKRPHEVTSWSVGPKTSMTASKQNRGSLLTAQVPLGFSAGSRFQVLTGDQAGVFTATSVTPQTNGTTTVEFTPNLPVPWDLWGHKYIEVTFETKLTTKPSSFRLDIDTEQQVAELRISGATQGVIATLDGTVPVLPPPSQMALLLNMDGNGQVFWGSLSRQATNRSTWSFLRYAVVPDRVFLQGHAVVVNTEMDYLPELDPEAEWFPQQTFGGSTLSAGKLLLKTGSGDETLDLTYGYLRVEPFFIPDALFDFRAKVALDSGCLGAGDVELRLDDTQRLVRVVPLLYLGGFGGTTDRRLVNLPATSMAGFALPSVMGWTAPSALTPTPVVEGTQLVVTQTATARGWWEKHLDWSDTYAPPVDEDGRLFEARLAVTAYTANINDDTGIRFGCQVVVPGGWAVVQAELRGGATPGVRLRTATGLPAEEYNFDWTDGLPHTYRVLVDLQASTVTLVIDDTVQVPSADLADFDGGVNSTQTFFGCYGINRANLADPDITCTVEWSHFHCHALPPLAAHRTFGVWTGKDRNDINNYEIPRTDTSTAPNSWAVGPVIEDMDWRQECELRVYHDPGWGVTVFRPDLPLPPYWHGDKFVTDSTEPSAGWINVESANLPVTEQALLGQIGFGSFDSRSLSQSRWDWVRYRMFRHPSVDRIAPKHMLLNQYNVVTSGEVTQDVGVEQVAVESLDWKRVTLQPTHLYAASIYKILDGQTLYTSNDWTFDSASQTVTLLANQAGEPRFFGTKLTGTTGSYTAGSTTFTDASANFLSNVAVGDYLHIWFGKAAGDYEVLAVLSATSLRLGKAPVVTASGAYWSVTSVHTVLEVYFIPGSPVTSTYLLNQPLLDGVTRLNEGTPPVPKSQIATAQVRVIQGSQLNTPADVDDPNPPLNLADPFKRMEFYDKSGTYYEDLTFFEVTDEGQTGLITGICEGGPGTGASGWSSQEGTPIGAEVWDFSGTMFWEDAKSPMIKEVTQKGGMPGGILFASGGNFVNPVSTGSGGATIPGALVAGGGTLGPGTAVLWPSFPSRGPVGGDHGRIYKRTDWLIKWGPGVNSDGLVETFDFSAGDTTPATKPANWVENPNGTTNPTGVAYGLMQYAGNYSHIGPWGGLKNLNPDRDYGTFRMVAPVEGSTAGVYDPNLGMWVTFTARAIPLLPTDFALAPTPHIALAAAINAYAFVAEINATPGLTLSGQMMVQVETVTPVTYPSDLYYLRVGSPAEIQLTGMVPLTSTQGLMTNGSGIIQSSLLAGGSQTGAFNVPANISLGMVAYGGSALPAGAQLNLTFQIPPM